MRGEFIHVWPEMWSNVWRELAQHPTATRDLFCELYRTLDSVLKPLAGAAAKAFLFSDGTWQRRVFEAALGHAKVSLKEAERDALYRSAIDETEKLSVSIVDSLVKALSRIMTPSSSRQSWDAAVEGILQNGNEMKELRCYVVAEASSNRDKAMATFQATSSSDITSERRLVKFLEEAHEICADRDEALAQYYFELLGNFITKFSLRYDLRRPCRIGPSLPGIFTGLVAELRAQFAQNHHIDDLMKEFETAVHDLHIDCSPSRIKTCIQKQVNLLEAIGQDSFAMKRPTLSKICEKIEVFPHEKLKSAMKDLYGFACDYPGIRHGGTPDSDIRQADMRDLVVMTILLTGFTPYLTDRLNMDVIRQGT
jgi:hypothetical protein